MKVLFRQAILGFKEPKAPPKYLGIPFCLLPVKIPDSLTNIFQWRRVLPEIIKSRIYIFIPDFK